MIYPLWNLKNAIPKIASVGSSQIEIQNVLCSYYKNENLKNMPVPSETKWEEITGWSSFLKQRSKQNRTANELSTAK